MSSALVRCRLVGEDTQPAPHEPGDTVRVAAGASSVHQVTDLEDAIGARAARPAVGQALQGVRQLGQAVDTRAALPRALPLHVAHDVRHLRQRADVPGQQGDHPGTEG